MNLLVCTTDLFVLFLPLGGESGGQSVLGRHAPGLLADTSVHELIGLGPGLQFTQQRQLALNRENECRVKCE